MFKNGMVLSIFLGFQEIEKYLNEVDLDDLSWISRD